MADPMLAQSFAEWDDRTQRALRKNLPVSSTFQQFGRRVISGEARGIGAAALRLGLSGLSPLYALIMRLRNAKFDRQIGVHRLDRPVISVGNMTAGGTGKTPVVRWLCEQMRQAGHRPAVLMRGYKARPGERGDEQMMLETLLDRPGAAQVIVHAQADRYAGGLAVLKAHPQVDLFVLDDGFQHRRLARDFDLVLLDASAPLGFGRVFPRGLLREPACGLARADAILVTRSDLVRDVAAVDQLLRRFNRTSPIFHCSHEHTGLRAEDGVLHEISELAGKRFFALAGIGNPRAFARQLQAMPGQCAGQRWFVDHWRYGQDDVEQVIQQAKQAAANVILTTDKDWAKLSPLLKGGSELPFWRAEVALKFSGEDESELFALLRRVLDSRSE